MCMTQLVACLIEHRSMSVRISLQWIFIYVLRKLVHCAFSVVICFYRVNDKKLKCRKEATLRAALFTNFTALQFCCAILCILLCRNRLRIRSPIFVCLSVSLRYCDTGLDTSAPVNVRCIVQVFSELYCVSRFRRCHIMIRVMRCQNICDFR